jgi:transcriptional regulator with XRE-family HTH domain
MQASSVFASRAAKQADPKVLARTVTAMQTNKDNANATRLLSMARTTTLAERLIRIREAAGFGGPRQASSFARKLGISPASLHDLESGKTKNVEKALAGYLRIGAAPGFILEGRGEPLRENAEIAALAVKLAELEPEELAIIEAMIERLRLRK